MTEPEGRLGDWIQLISGEPFWPLDPRPEEIELDDIAWSLSMQCRFAGHVKRRYSVAEHSIMVSRYVPPEFALWGLLHDATEAYMVDVPRPVKRSMPEYRLHDVLQRSSPEGCGVRREWIVGRSCIGPIGISLHLDAPAWVA